MKEFIFAFPLAESLENVSVFLEKLQIRNTSGAIIVPGCSVALEVFVKPSVASLSELFMAHRPLDESEKVALDAHQSLFFLKGSLNGPDSLREINVLISKAIAAGALGVYAEHSGAAQSAKAFSEMEIENAPLDFWLNFIETKNVLYTLGLESFSLPDLCVSNSNGNSEKLQDLLLTVAEYLYLERVLGESGTKVETEEKETFELCKENSPLFTKNDPEWNRLGTMRLVKR